MRYSNDQKFLAKLILLSKTYAGSPMRSLEVIQEEIKPMAKGVNPALYSSFLAFSYLIYKHLNQKPKLGETLKLLQAQPNADTLVAELASLSVQEYSSFIQEKVVALQKTFGPPATEEDTSFSLTVSPAVVPPPPKVYDWGLELAIRLSLALEPKKPFKVEDSKRSVAMISTKHAAVFAHIVETRLTGAFSESSRIVYALGQALYNKASTSIFHQQRIKETCENLISHFDLDTDFLKVLATLEWENIFYIVEHTVQNLRAEKPNEIISGNPQELQDKAESIFALLRAALKQHPSLHGVVQSDYKNESRFAG